MKLGGLREGGRLAKVAALERAEGLLPIFEELAGLSLAEIAEELNARGVRTLKGKPWNKVTVMRMRDRIAAG